MRDWGIDPYRIYTTGCGVGGLQAACMGMKRSSYVGAVTTNSGGELDPLAPQNPNHVPSVMTMYSENDFVGGVDYVIASDMYDSTISSLSGEAVACSHTAGHCGAPPELQHAAMQFLFEHPFGVEPKPYAAGLPSNFPSSCALRF